MSTIRKVKNPPVEGGLFGKAIDTNHFTPSHHEIKMATKRSIVTLAVWGLIPANIATWPIRVGGLTYE